MANKLLNRKAIIFLICVIAAFLMPTGCEDTFNLNVDCDKCYEAEPSKGYLNITLSPSGENDSVFFQVFEGKVENKNIIYEDSTNLNLYTLFVNVNTYYSAKAYYKQGDKTIIAIDGDELKSKLVNDACGNTPCYYTYGGDIDISLKFNAPK